MHIELYSVVTFLLLLFLKKVLLLPLSSLDRADGVLLRTVPLGATVILKCTSNDYAHLFQYWHLVEKGSIIGPANEYDIAKYKYEVLSGNLTIRRVSKQDEGLYECVSRAVRGEDINIKVVRVVVHSDWEEVYETDYNINLIRILIALITLVLVTMAAWFVYRIWKDRYRYPKYLEPEEEAESDESTEELFTRPSTSKVNNHIVPPKGQKPKDSAFNDVDISTDFKSILENASQK